MTRIGLLQCGRVHPAARSLRGDYDALFGSLLAPFDVRIDAFVAYRHELPASIDDADAWIISGARASVLDEAGWLDETEAFVGELLRAERPLVGVCFGHQLLAKVAGGVVDRSATGWSVGVKAYEVVERRPWMRPALDRVRLVASHEDQVVEPPPDARVLARSDRCPNAVLAVGDRALGVQAHPEFDAAASRALLDANGGLYGGHTAAEARTTLDRPLDRTSVGRWIATFLGAGDVG